MNDLTVIFGLIATVLSIFGVYKTYFVVKESDELINEISQG
jgi:hypothetical protein